MNQLPLGLFLKLGSKQGLSSRPTSRARCLSRFQFTMGSGGSALKDATTQQVSEAFASLSPEEQKKAEDHRMLGLYGSPWHLSI